MPPVAGAGPGPNQEAWISIHVSQVADMDPSTGAIIFYLPGFVLIRSCKQKWSWDASPGTLLWDVSVPRSILPTVPNATPLSIILLWWQRNLTTWRQGSGSTMEADYSMLPSSVGNGCFCPKLKENLAEGWLREEHQHLGVYLDFTGE